VRGSSGVAEAEARPELEPDPVGRQALFDRIGHAADGPEPEPEAEPQAETETEAD